MSSLTHHNFQHIFRQAILLHMLRGIKRPKWRYIIPHSQGKLQVTKYMDPGSHDHKSSYRLPSTCDPFSVTRSRNIDRYATIFSCKNISCIKISIPPSTIKASFDILPWSKTEVIEFSGLIVQSPEGMSYSTIATLGTNGNFQWVLYIARLYMKHLQ